jgi:multiple antibiotic resistance protein
MQILSSLGNLGSFPKGLLLGFPALFSIIDPIGNSVIFSQMTSDRSRAERRAIAGLVGLYALILLLAALWAGSPILHFFGVTLSALKVGGGIVVAAAGWRLLFQDEQDESHTTEAREAAADQATGPPAGISDFAFFPVTMPLVVGPGAISVAITLGATQRGNGIDLPYLFGVSLAAAVSCAIIVVLFRYADLIGRVLGPSGSRAVKRIVALLLLSIGVQILSVGLQDMLVSFVRAASHVAAAGG